MESEERNLFSVEENFFVITPENASGVQTKLYGWAIAGDGIVTDAADLEGLEPTPEGCYVLVEREGAAITIRQDFLGCYGLYLFREGDWWALSNSFLYLVDFVKRGHRITFDRAYADQALTLTLASSTYSETMVDEIELLDRSATVSIDVGAGSLSYELTDFGENTVPLDSAEGMALLDAWYGRWTSVIRNLKEQTDALQVDLSGGFDSREVFALFLGSGINLNEVCVHSHDDSLHTHAEDFEIASRIAETYGFGLNRSGNMPRADINYTRGDALNISLYSKLGFHRQMYWKCTGRSAYAFAFTGGGGESVRGHWARDYGSRAHLVEAFSRDAVKLGEEGPRIRESTQAVLERTFDEVADKYEGFGRELSEPDLIGAFYRDTRCRFHFGRTKVESFSAGLITLTPLLDHDLQKLRICTDGCPDTQLLMAVMLDRYNPGLLDFKYEGGRGFSAETLACARGIDERFPVHAPEADAGNVLALPARRPAAAGRAEAAGGAANARVAGADVRALVIDAFRSPELEGAFEAVYSPDTYRSLARYIEEREFFPESAANAAIAIAKVYRACLASDEVVRSRSAASFVLQQAELGADAPERDRSDSEVERLRDRNSELLVKNEELRARNEELRARNEELTAIKNSRSFRIGRAITWLPRKVRDLFKR